MENISLTYQNTTSRFYSRFIIAIVWLINGLYCKVLQQVPRHQEIVAKITGPEYANSLTIIIGVAEILMAVWILTGIWSRLNAIVQISVILSMNILETVLAPELLLWGRFNLVFAILLVIFIYFVEFHLPTRSARKV